MTARVTVFGAQPSSPWICKIFPKSIFTVVTALLLFLNYCVCTLLLDATQLPQGWFYAVTHSCVDFLWDVLYNVQCMCIAVPNGLLLVNIFSKGRAYVRMYTKQVQITRSRNMCRNQSNEIMYNDN